MLTLLTIIFMFSLWVLPFILARRGWSSSAIGYTVGAINTFIVTIIRSSAVDGVIRIPWLPEFLLDVVSGTLITGTILWGIIALVRK